MRRVLHAVALLGLVMAGAFILLAIVAWPPGGLMFALPYVFLWMAALLGLPSLIVLLVTRSRAAGQESRSRRQEGVRHS
jgi:hypothetical protein